MRCVCLDLCVLDICFVCLVSFFLFIFKRNTYNRDKIFKLKTIYICPRFNYYYIHCRLLKTPRICICHALSNVCNIKLILFQLYSKISEEWRKYWNNKRVIILFDRKKINTDLQKILDIWTVPRQLLKIIILRTYQFDETKMNDDRKGKILKNGK